MHPSIDLLDFVHLQMQWGQPICAGQNLSYKDRLGAQGPLYLVKKGSYCHFILTLIGKSGRQL